MKTVIERDLIASYTVDKIRWQDKSAVRKCFDFIKTRIANLNLDLENALGVSCCEDLVDNSKIVSEG